jgi:hypothetical protein
MPKPATQPDVLVVGEHPACYFAAALLRHAKSGGSLNVVHCTLPEAEVPDRLVLVNPAFFSLHKLLEPLKRSIPQTAIYGARFLADDGSAAGEYRERNPVACVAGYHDVRAAVEGVAAESGVRLLKPDALDVCRVDERGLEVEADGKLLRATVLILGAATPTPWRRRLGLPDGWPRDVQRRYTFLRLNSTKAADLPAKPCMPMSLDLRGQLTWAWLLPGRGEVQLAVEQPASSAGPKPSVDLLKHWAGVLHKHGVLKTSDLPFSEAESVDLPLAGALVQEGVANRAVLVGPAGGFYSATGEDIYPNCWSAVFAADAVRKALKETHLQDALQPYRQKWGATLGDYIRGPQQNLRFLLPLIYRNPTMTTRLGESILLGKSVIR